MPSGTKITVTPKPRHNWSYKFVNYDPVFDRSTKTFTITKDSSFECFLDPVF